MNKLLLSTLPFLFIIQLSYGQVDKDLESKLNYCAYENSLLEAQNKRLKEFTGRQHREVMDLKIKIFDYQSQIHKYQIDSIKVSKAPIALLKLANFMEAEKNHDQAAAIYKLLIDIYPGWDEADSARVRLSDMDHWIGKK